MPRAASDQATLAAGTGIAGGDTVACISSRSTIAAIASTRSSSAAVATLSARGVSTRTSVTTFRSATGGIGVASAATGAAFPRRPGPAVSTGSTFPALACSIRAVERRNAVRVVVTGTPGSSGSTRTQDSIPSIAPFAPGSPVPTLAAVTTVAARRRPMTAVPAIASGSADVIVELIIGVGEARIATTATVSGLASGRSAVSTASALAGRSPIVDRMAVTPMAPVATVAILRSISTGTRIGHVSGNLLLRLSPVRVRHAHPLH